MKKNKVATESEGYLRFIAKRDRALEQIHTGANEEINDLLRRALLRALEIVAFKYAQIPEGGMLTILGKKVLSEIENAIVQEFILSARHIAFVIEQMNKNVYALSLVGEAEAIGRAIKTPAVYEVPRGTLSAVSTEDMQGESIEGRVALAFSRIRRKLMDSIELSRVKEETTDEAIARAKAVLPKPRTVKRPKKKLMKVTEAAGDIGEPYSEGFIDDADWKEIVDAYTEQYVPKWRGPETVTDVTVDGLLEEWYGWEIEQYVSNEFVEKVRLGQNEAAKQNGIKDMVWIAVIDDKTDECCAWRDGLTSSEIEQKLKQGAHKNDECEAIVPPAHFNCRCTMAPLLDVQMTGEEFEKPPSNAQEFETWLNT